jgi:hypothetical protein
MALPEHIQNAPRLWPGSLLYYDAFWSLSSCRTYGQGIIGEIPWTAVRSYADEYEFGGDQRATLFHAILALDAVYRSKQSK